MPRRLLALPFVFVLASGVAWAYWSAGSVAGGYGASAATTVSQGATPTASVSGNAVTVSWAPTTLSNGTPVDGYIVKRYDVATVSEQTMLSACTGTITATTCVENVPAGQWRYSVTPVFFSWSGVKSPMSNQVTVVVGELTPPVNAISMSVVTGNAAMNGNNIFYKGSSPGSFTLTNALTDSGTSPASSSTTNLTGTTGWTHTPWTATTPAGGPYASDVFTWTNVATSTGSSEVVTGHDVAGNSAATTLSFINDSTPPAPGTIDYAAGYQAGRSVAITFSGATDSGSGLGVGQLQRQSAPLTGGLCGTYSSFVNLGQANPISPYISVQVTNGVCYRYQYVVSDLVGNQATVTGTNEAMVDYAGAVNATAGLLSQWRLGETTTSSDAFTGTVGTLLTNHTGEIGATWAYLAEATTTSVISETGTLRRSGIGTVTAYTSPGPTPADYLVQADVTVKSVIASDYIGVIGRADTAGSSEGTFYIARYNVSATQWEIYCYVNGVQTIVGTPYPQTLTAGQTYRLGLGLNGTAISLLVDGAVRVSGSDSKIAGSGHAGVRFRNAISAPTDTTGLHLDNFTVTPHAADSKGSNTGDYLNGPALGVAGRIAGDVNTAAQFDGVNDYVQAVGTTGVPVGATARSVEMWFKTSSGAKQVLFSYGSLATNAEFGLWLDAGSTTMTAWGYPTGATNDRTFNLGPAVNDGAWHQVVETYDGTDITIYIDGAALTAQAATRATGIDARGFTIGAITNALDPNYGNFFHGSLDEVSLYTTALDQTTVTNHHLLGTSPAPDLLGPTGGSVAAGGLAGTGSLYSTSTVLSLNLVPGTDPSAVSTTGAQLRRATATLNSGSCGSYGADTLVSGGTDAVSPKSDIVADQACYRYTYTVADTLGNNTTYQSTDIKVDTTAPAPPTLTFGTFTNTYWSEGQTVFYRSAATSGSFKATATSTDSASGIAGYGFPTLGSSWSAPGSNGVNTYSWSGAPAPPGTKSVAATNNAAKNSAGTSFTLTADDTAPTTGTVSYLDGASASTSVSVSFTNGTDGGSGIGTRLLQRASATLTGTTCGTFTGYSTGANGTNPTSPLVDTVSRGSCYKYQYVVSDKVSNQGAAAVSANVVQVPSYFDTINATLGLAGYWRLGGATTSSDTFTGTDGATLQSHAGEIGGIWSKHALSTADATITASGRIRKDGDTALQALYYNDLAVPASADYTVEADVYVSSLITNDVIGVIGRLDPAVAAGTYYSAVYDRLSQMWTLHSRVSGTTVLIGQSSVQMLTAGQTYRLTLDMNGSAIRLLVNGAEQVSVVNAAISAPGRGGVTLGFGQGGGTVTSTTGLALDNFAVSPPLADSVGANNGGYLGGPTLGVAGGIIGDANTAVKFDGVNDFGTVTRTIKDDFSIEFWFKSTTGVGSSTGWWQGAGLIDAEGAVTTNDFGVSLTSNGMVVAGVGATVSSEDVSIHSSTGYANGAWHHVVFTRTMATGALQLYIDGASAGSATGNKLSLVSPTNIIFGRIQTTNKYFSGTLDEVAVYTTVIPGTTVTSHNDAGR